MIIPSHIKNEYTAYGTPAYHNKITSAFNQAFLVFPEVKGRVRLVRKKHNVWKTTMSAWPNVKSFLFDRVSKRSYDITIYEDASNIALLEVIPSQALVGWFGHEFGHIVVDYLHRSRMQLCWFIILYVCSRKARRKNELDATFYAVYRGLQKEVILSERFTQETPFYSKEQKLRQQLHYFPTIHEIKHYLSNGLLAFKNNMSKKQFQTLEQFTSRKPKVKKRAGKRIRSFFKLFFARPK
jgi:hypothetical protein